MKGPAGELDGRCSWCGWKLPAHDPACRVPSLVAQLTPPPPPPPTSRELYAAAQRAGETVGHEWGSKTGHAPPE